jgi:hypothetical protein
MGLLAAQRVGKIRAKRPWENNKAVGVTLRRSQRGMSYHFDEEEIPTLELALRSKTSKDLRKLAAVTGKKVPSRKDDIAALIVQHLAGERLAKVWESLDELQRAAVAEAVHSPSSRFDTALFRAKYGQDPDWVLAAEFGHGRKPSALCFFSIGTT